jgi:hypothetical protein
VGEYEGRRIVVLKGLIAASASLALMATPALAASPAPAAQLAQLSPASESVDGMAISRGGYVIGFFVVIAIGLGIWALSGDDNDKDEPASP